MTENFKTTLFGLSAIFIALIAFYVTRPVASPVDVQEEVGALLYPAFKDPLAAGSLEILSFDAATATPKDFKVALINNRWVIPSHENYPTDAEKQLPAAAGSLLDLKILELKTSESAEHAQYGVLDPDPAKNELKSNSEGIGTKVVLDDKSGKNIMRLIIGKEDPSQQGVRFVRREGQDKVYAAKVDTGKLSTKFEDWIEPDLLKVNAWDIASVDLDNYSIDEAAGGIVDGDVIRLKYDDMATESKWTLEDLQAGEELNVARLDELKDALDDLRIVDVRRKPAGLSAELKTSEGITLDREALLSLQDKGYFLTQDGELKSNEGEALVGTKDGIEYGLRFGEIAADSAMPGGESDGGPAKGQNRYVFISAQFNKDRIEPPKLQPLPGEEGAAESTEAAPAAPETPTTGEQPPAAPDPDDAGTNTEQPAAGTCQPAEPDATAEQPAETPAAEQAADAATQSPDQISADVERQRIEAENKRQQTLYDQKVQDGEKKAQELNARFADWYYVISDDIYKKIKVNRADIIKGIDPLTGEKNTLEEFEQLKNALPQAPATETEAAPAESAPAEQAPPENAPKNE